MKADFCSVLHLWSRGGKLQKCLKVVRAQTNGTVCMCCLAHQKDKSCFDLYKIPSVEKVSALRVAEQSREKDQELNAEAGWESH